MNYRSAVEAAGEEFGAALARLVRRLVLKTVTIESIDEDNNVANVTFFEGDVPVQVPLSLFGVGTANVTVVPTVGSVAVVANPDGDESRPQFLWFESIDKFVFKRGSIAVALQADPNDESNDSLSLSLGDSSIDVASDAIQLNGGSLGGLVVVGKLTERLNKLASELDTLQTNILSHSHATPSGPTSGTTYVKAAISTFTDDDYVNEKIKQ